MKVRFFDKSLVKKYFYIVAAVASIVSILAIAIDIEAKYKWICFGVIVVMLIILYVILWAAANKTKRAHFKINGTNVNIFVGDIFAQNYGLKVIPMNEYFDTQVDNVVVSEHTLHGIYIKTKCKSIQMFEANVKSTLTPARNNPARTVPNHQDEYELGSIVKDGDYLLTAFTKFDQNNRAYLDGKNYFYFLGSFWNNVDKIYAGNNLFVPLMGSGITRFNMYSPSNQELLENLLITMKRTGFRNKYHDKSVNIVIYKDYAKEIDFYHLKEWFGD